MVGLNNAYRYILRAEWVNADEANRLGLVQEYVPDRQQLDKAIALAEKNAVQAPLGIQAILKSTRIAQTKGSQIALAKVK